MFWVDTPPPVQKQGQNADEKDREAEEQEEAATAAAEGAERTGNKDGTSAQTQDVTGASELVPPGDISLTPQVKIEFDEVLSFVCRLFKATWETQCANFPVKIPVFLSVTPMFVLN